MKGENIHVQYVYVPTNHSVGRVLLRLTALLTVSHVCLVFIYMYTTHTRRLVIAQGLQDSFMIETGVDWRANRCQLVHRLPSVKTLLLYCTSLCVVEHGSRN